MKKLYFVLIFAMCLPSLAQNVNIPDPFFKDMLLQATATNSLATDAEGNSIIVDVNGDNEIQVTEALAVYGLSLSYFNISSLSGIQSFTNLQYLECNYNVITSLDLSGMAALQELHCTNSQLASLNLDGCTALRVLDVESNFLQALDISDCVALEEIWVGLNELTSLDVSSHPMLTDLLCDYNQITELDLSVCQNLMFLSCDSNELTTLDLTKCNPESVYLNYNNISSLLVKNGQDQSGINMTFYDNPLVYICTDDSEADYFQYLIDSYGMNTEINSYCSFAPGGESFVIQGTNTFDTDGNGCGSSDPGFPNMKFTITDGTISGTIIADSSGSYSIPVSAGTHIMTPVLANPGYFNASPTSASIEFPAQPTPSLNHFCITADGLHTDVQVTIIPLDDAVPGFDSRYRIIYKNIGTQPASGSITMTFEGDFMDVVTSVPAADSQTDDTLSWNYSGLLPFESGSMDITVNINAPTDTPAVNIGDQLDFEAAISTTGIDENVANNTSGIKQIVVGSLDPNDITCLEGPLVAPEIAGNYVHYLIRFENVGTYPAQNVVVRDEIDSTVFDPATLDVVASSHPMVVRLTGTVAEFIFEGIQLPFDDAANDGYLVMKLQTRPELTLGDTFSNSANIYFDYNFPVATNLAVTQIQSLGIGEQALTEMAIYPNPASQSIAIANNSNLTIAAVYVYDLSGRMVLSQRQATNGPIQIGNLTPGSYFLRIVSDQGSAIRKFIKI